MYTGVKILSALILSALLYAGSAQAQPSFGRDNDCDEFSLDVYNFNRSFNLLVQSEIDYRHGKKSRGHRDAIVPQAVQVTDSEKKFYKRGLGIFENLHSSYCNEGKVPASSKCEAYVGKFLADNNTLKTWVEQGGFRFNSDHGPVVTAMTVLNQNDKLFRANGLRAGEGEAAVDLIGPRNQHYLNLHHHIDRRLKQLCAVEYDYAYGVSRP